VEVESSIAAHNAATPTAAAVDPAALDLLATNLATVWSAPTTDARLKKRIVRTLIEEVVADIDDAVSEIVLRIHWAGGVHSEIRLPKRRRGQRNSTAADVIATVRQLAQIASDDLIAGILNRNDLKTGYGNRWTRERVTSRRCARTTASRCSNMPQMASSRGSISPTPRSSLRSRARPCGWRRKPARSRPAIPCPMAHGSSPGLRSQPKQHNRSPHERARTPDTPWDRIPLNKTSSFQEHRQMGVLMRGCTTTTGRMRAAGADLP
jgi:hypothetical protein